MSLCLACLEIGAGKGAGTEEKHVGNDVAIRRLSKLLKGKRLRKPHSSFHMRTLRLRKA